MDPRASRLLIIGYGNPGRRDDGLGPALAAALEDLDLPGVTIEADYQLTVEDAAAVAEHDVVLFVDAACTGPEPFDLRRLAPGPTATFSTHSIQPDSVLALAQELFGARAEAYVLGIRGYEFNEFGEVLSERARVNLAAALEFVQPIVRERTFCEAAARSDEAPARAAPAIGDI